MSTVPFDTALDIAERVRQRLMARSGSDRVAMATRMFHTAKVLARSRIIGSGVTDEINVQLAVLAQLYGDELTPAQYAAVRARLQARGRVNPE